MLRPSSCGCCVLPPPPLLLLLLLLLLRRKGRVGFMGKSLNPMPAGCCGAGAARALLNRSGAAPRLAASS